MVVQCSAVLCCAMQCWCQEACTPHATLCWPRCCFAVQDLMSEQGGHRPATLKCGHIFGEACIRRWLKEKSRCPQCNKP